MNDRYQSFTSSPIGQLFVKNLGLPSPVRLDRYKDGAPLVDGTVVIGGAGRLIDPLVTALDDLGIASTKVAAEGEKYLTMAIDLYAKGDRQRQEAEQELKSLRTLRVGKPAPEIKAGDLDGKEFKLSEYRGKVVLLDFWGNW
jgi:hypothetical protein